MGATSYVFTPAFIAASRVSAQTVFENSDKLSNDDGLVFLTDADG